MKNVPAGMQECIDVCLVCYQTCLSTAMNHCLEMGGKHIEPKHFRTMMECANMCHMTAHALLMNAPHHASLCDHCAEICEDCARSCHTLEGMEECIIACNDCTEACRGGRWKTAKAA